MRTVDGNSAQHGLGARIVFHFAARKTAESDADRAWRVYFFQRKAQLRGVVVLDLHGASACCLNRVASQRLELIFEDTAALHGPQRYPVAANLPKQTPADFKVRGALFEQDSAGRVIPPL